MKNSISGSIFVVAAVLCFQVMGFAQMHRFTQPLSSSRDCVNIGSDLQNILLSIDRDRSEIKPDSFSQPAVASLGEARDKVVALQKILQPAGAKPNDPVIYSYAYNVEGYLLETTNILFGARQAIMITAGNRSGPGGKGSVPGNANALKHFDLITATITMVQSTEVKGGHCYLDAYLTK